jgi:predicted RNA-binding Zn-ribbon protein involved in translation (DUF1610 family)
MQPPFPPQGFVRTHSALAGIEVYMPAPPAGDDQRPVVEFSCPQCGAQTAFSAADGGLTCTHCSYYEPPQQAVVGRRAEEFEFTLETVNRAAQGWGEARTELQCQSCGAYTSVPADSMTHTCAFCGSNRVINRQAAQDVLRPRFLIPFKIDPETCHHHAREWLGGSWLVPGELRRLASLGLFTGIYLPYWTFDATTAAGWKAEVAHKKKTRDNRTKTVWKWETGQASQHFDDLTIAGTNQLSRLLLGRIEKFDLSDLAPYEPKYLAGLQAQSYEVSLEEAWEMARHKMRELTHKACRAQASSQHMRNFSLKLDFSEERWRYILLPIYLNSFRYRAKTYQVMVNGQTGEIAGQRPVDWLKVSLAAVALVAPGATLYLASLSLQRFFEVGAWLVLPGLVLAFIGFVVAVYFVGQATQLDEV